MGKRAQRRRRQKKLRAAGLLPPKPDRMLSAFATRRPEDRDPRTRWTACRVRGAGVVSLTVTDAAITVEADLGGEPVGWCGRRRTASWNPAAGEPVGPQETDVSDV